MPSNLKSKIKSFSSSDKSKWMVPVIILFLLVLIAGGYFLLQALVVNQNEFTVSGTVEAVVIHLGTETGGRVDRVLVQEGEKVQAGQTLATVRGDNIHAPIDGVILDRVVEPGEVISAGATLLTMSDLEVLTLTVYVPEDRYGKIMLGQSCPVSVDSFPGETFIGTVSQIAQEAEFTPRNVQTTDSRKNTVFAIKLSLAPSGGRLKPGMPADVLFQNGN